MRKFNIIYSDTKYLLIYIFSNAKIFHRKIPPLFSKKDAIMSQSHFVNATLMSRQFHYFVLGSKRKNDVNQLISDVTGWLRQQQMCVCVYIYTHTHTHMTIFFPSIVWKSAYQTINHEVSSLLPGTPILEILLRDLVWNEVQSTHEDNLLISCRH